MQTGAVELSVEKQIAIEERIWEPDMMLVEAKAAGMPLADRDEVTEHSLSSPSRRGAVGVGGGIDKMTRMHMASPIESGKVLVSCRPEFAGEVIEEVASFPNGDHDDFCDSMTMALMRFRQVRFFDLQGEELEHASPAEKRVLLMAKQGIATFEDPEAFLGLAET